MHALLKSVFGLSNFDILIQALHKILFMYFLHVPILLYLYS